MKLRPIGRSFRALGREARLVAIAAAGAVTTIVVNLSSTELISDERLRTIGSGLVGVMVSVAAYVRSRPQREAAEQVVLAAVLQVLDGRHIIGDVEAILARQTVDLRHVARWSSRQRLRAKVGGHVAGALGGWLDELMRAFREETTPRLMEVQMQRARIHAVVGALGTAATAAHHASGAENSFYMDGRSPEGGRERASAWIELERAVVAAAAAAESLERALDPDGTVERRQVRDADDSSLLETHRSAHSALAESLSQLLETRLSGALALSEGGAAGRPVVVLSELLERGSVVLANEREAWPRDAAALDLVDERWTEVVLGVKPGMTDEMWPPVQAISNSLREVRAVLQNLVHDAAFAQLDERRVDRAKEDVARSVVTFSEGVAALRAVEVDD